MMMSWRQILVTVFTAAVISTGCVAVYFALHSPLFEVQVVEVADQPDQAPVDAQAISTLAAVPVGEISLFELDLKPIEKRLLANSWIKEVHLQKRFPQTLSIGVSYREPVAVLQEEDGQLGYVESDGKVFGNVRLTKPLDLPVLTGLAPAQIPQAARLVRLWEDSHLNSEIESVEWSRDGGYRALATYPVSASEKARTRVEFGQNLDGLEGGRLDHLSRVFGYLGTHSIAAGEIWADAEKKIVVKTAHGS